MTKSFKDLKLGDTVYYSTLRSDTDHATDCVIFKGELVNVEVQETGILDQGKVVLVNKHIYSIKEETGFVYKITLWENKIGPLGTTVNDSSYQTGAKVYTPEYDMLKDIINESIKKQIDYLDKKILKLQGEKMILSSKII